MNKIFNNFQKNQIVNVCGFHGEKYENGQRKLSVMKCVVENVRKDKILVSQFHNRDLHCWVEETTVFCPTKRFSRILKNGKKIAVYRYQVQFFD
jgi:hypothetical protein